jgi:hypothetical protein
MWPDVGVRLALCRGCVPHRRHSRAVRLRDVLVGRSSEAGKDPPMQASLEATLRRDARLVRARPQGKIQRDRNLPDIGQWGRGTNDGWCSAPAWRRPEGSLRFPLRLALHEVVRAERSSLLSRACRSKRPRRRGGGSEFVMESTWCAPGRPKGAIGRVVRTTYWAPHRALNGAPANRPEVRQAGGLPRGWRRLRRRNDRHRNDGPSVPRQRDDPRW